MTQDSAQRTFILLSSKVSPLASTDIECAVLPWDQLKAEPSELSSAGAARWDKDTQAQYARKREEEAPKKTAGSSEPDEGCIVRVNTSAGGASIFLFLPPQTTTFELHCELRKAFGDVIDSTQKLRLNVKHLSDEQQNRALVAFAILAETSGWKPTVFGRRKEGSKAPKKPAPVEVVSSLPRDPAEDLAKRGALLGLANNRVRTLADLPANELNPRSYRKHVEQFAKERKLEVEFLDVAELQRRKAGAFLAVGQADLARGQGIAIVTYRPSGKTGKSAKGKSSGKHLALVGKGICFDTGGYNLKPGHSMLGMHGDMTGSAIALALCAYFAETQAPFEVRAYLALSENLISSSAYRPNEVVIAGDGTSIEVVDTDAEGRMVLSDTLVLASREKPALMLDFATLTGGAIRALDTRRGAIFSNRPELARLAVECGDASGERTWSFPIGADYRKELKSKIADIVQCAPGNNADHIYAATFLSHFAGSTPWVHLDLVPSENKGGLGLIASDTTGFGVLWAEEFVGRAL